MEERTQRSTARDVATTVLARVEGGGAWAAPTLDAELRRARLDDRDAALATQIVYGALRVLPTLDGALSARLKKPLGRLDGLTRAALRAGAYQILCLGRVPPHAAVDGAVTFVRRKRGAQLGGLVNAVLRRVAEGRPEERAPPSAVDLPAWLAEALPVALGPERARIFRSSRELPPPVGLRVVRHRTTREALAEAIGAARPGARVELGRVSPLALLVRGAGDPRALPGFEEGLFTIQEQGAQAVALLAGARSGERVADACAGRGGKTTLLLEAVGEAGRVTALDLHEQKLDRVGVEAARLGLRAAAVDVVAVDLSVGVAGLEGRFDRVLVDAPCTGLGTLHRRPEILLRLGPDDPARMGALQRAILDRALALLGPGGTLVYAVCSPMREEGADVVASFGEAHAGDLEPVEEPWGLDTVQPDPDGLVRVGPWDGDCDAYQVARWRRSSSSASTSGTSTHRR